MEKSQHFLPLSRYPHLMRAFSLAFLLAATAHAQTDEAGLRARLLGHTVFLRTFTSDDNLKFDATGQPDRAYKPDSFTLCGFRVDEVKLGGHRLQLKGQRMGLVWKDHVLGELPLEGGGLRSKPEKLTIEIDNGSAADFSPALDAVFATQLGDLTSSLPAIWQAFAAANFDPRPPANPDAPSDSHAQRGSGKPTPASFHAPHPISTPEPEFSETARRMRYASNVMVYLKVGADGSPSRIRVVRPAGLGLDEKAVEAVSRYRFAPA